VLLHQFDWPGNVRQLQNVLERAVVLAEQGVIGPEHLVPEIRSPVLATPRPPAAGAPPLGERPTVSPDLTSVALADVEREHVLRVLEAAGGRREVAAKALGISRRTLTRMLQRWDIDFPRHQS
jgi:Nif-specific regulatory protein